MPSIQTIIILASIFMLLGAALLCPPQRWISAFAKILVLAGIAGCILAGFLSMVQVLGG